MKYETIYVKLANDGGVVINPSTAKRLKAKEVTPVPNAPFWRRRIKAGNVILCDKSGKELTKTKEAPKKTTEPKTSDAPKLG